MVGQRCFPDGDSHHGYPGFPPRIVVEVREEGSSATGSVDRAGGNNYSMRAAAGQGATGAPTNNPDEARRVVDRDGRTLVEVPSTAAQGASEGTPNTNTAATNGTGANNDNTGTGQRNESSGGANNGSSS